LIEITVSLTVFSMVFYFSSREDFLSSGSGPVGSLLFFCFPGTFTLLLFTDPELPLSNEFASPLFLKLFFVLILLWTLMSDSAA
jgi:hypothetical protein